MHLLLSDPHTQRPSPAVTETTACWELIPGHSQSGLGRCGQFLCRSRTSGAARPSSPRAASQCHPACGPGAVLPTLSSVREGPTSQEQVQVSGEIHTAVHTSATPELRGQFSTAQYPQWLRGWRMGFRARPGRRTPRDPTVGESARGRWLSLRDQESMSLGRAVGHKAPVTGLRRQGVQGGQRERKLEASRERGQSWSSGGQARQTQSHNDQVASGDLTGGQWAG